MLKHLTNEEKIVLELLGQGETLKEIKTKLGISMYRIIAARDSAVAKLEARNQPHAVYLAMLKGLIDYG